MRTSFSRRIGERLMGKKIVLLMCCGFLYAFIIPPFEAPDEPAHFLRAYGIAEGQIILRDHPRELIEFILSEIEKSRGDIDIPIIHDIQKSFERSEGRVPNIAFNSSHYSPVPYIFHAAVIRAVMFFNDTPEFFKFSFYLCRIMSLMLFGVTMAVSFRIVPSLAWVIFWVTATPMALSQASMVSPDYIILCASIFLIVISLGKLDDNVFAVALFFSTFFIFLSKFPYIPLICIPLASSILKKNGKRLLWVTVSLIVGILSSILWNYHIRNLGIYENMVDSIRLYVDPGIEPQKQLVLLLESPLKGVDVILSTISRTGLALGHQFVGVLGWTDIPIPSILASTWFMMSIAVLWISNPPPHISNRESKIIGAICLFSALLTAYSIILSIYLIWAPVGSDIVHLQGRYFHPLACAFLCGIILLIKHRTFSPHLSFVKYGLISFSWMINFISLYRVMRKFS